MARAAPLTRTLTLTLTLALALALTRARTPTRRALTRARTPTRRALHLATLPGYPAWERDVFDVLHAHFSTLGFLFLQYADVLGSAVGRPAG